MDVKRDEALLGDNNLPEIEKVKPLVFTPEARQYNSIGQQIKLKN